ncbi:MAG TPA: 7-cyano-7-deazaguanine synthase [Planctomycetaceae bacterium]|nr:7-cyano-7-deazaguanine synthase [Planctomycetaceae bacterium]
MTSAVRQVAVLLGGGIESTALVSRYLAESRPVTPVHVHCGLIWDDCEAAHVRQFCDASAAPGLAPLIEVRVSLKDFLGDHWAVTGVNVPRANDPAAKLEIPLRNLMLLSFALHRLKQFGEFSLALGTTIENCFRDGSRDYFDKCEEVLTFEAGWPVQVLTPLIGLTKTEVIRSADRRTLAHSFSCVNPERDRHCGRCIKCAKRQAAFRDAGVPDPTIYASQSSPTA